MTPIHSPQGRLVLGLIATAMTAVILFAGVLWWAVSPVVTPLPPRIQQTGAPVSATETKLAAERWTVELWRPLSDAPVAVAAPPPPPTVKLFSILNRGGVRVAALDLGGGEGLVYAKPGDVIGAITVVAIDAKGVDLQIAGRQQRLDLGK